MSWLDPTECTAARDFLRQGRPIEAAKVLLESRNREHRAVRRLLGEVGFALVAKAEGEFEAGTWAAAQSTLRLAAECAALDQRGLALHARIEEALAEKERMERAREVERAKVLLKIEEACRLAASGEFAAALRTLESLPADDARETIQEIRLTEERFSDALDRCREAVVARDAGLARHYWELIKQLCPQCPEIKRLAGEIARAASPDAGSAGRARPVSDRRDRFLVEDDTLVLLSDEIAIGAPHAENVQLPVLGRVHRRHAVLCRDRSGWRILPCRDRHGRPCPLRVNGKNISTDAGLQNGDRVELGDRHRPWIFRLPVPNSWTAIWEASAESEAGIFRPSGHALKRAIFLADELRIQPLAPAHLLIKNVACSGVVLRWQPQGLEWEIEGGQGWLESPGVTIASDDRAVYLPGRLVVESQWDEAERLGRMLVNAHAGERTTLKFDLWNA
ncbi:FHA domain-containing protein [Thermopirellula anaerolimosa]